MNSRCKPTTYSVRLAWRVSAIGSPTRPFVLLLCRCQKHTHPISSLEPQCCVRSCTLTTDDHTLITINYSPPSIAHSLIHNIRFMHRCFEAFLSLHAPGARIVRFVAGRLYVRLELMIKKHFGKRKPQARRLLPSAIATDCATPTTQPLQEYLNLRQRLRQLSRQPDLASAACQWPPSPAAPSSSSCRTAPHRSKSCCCHAA